MSPTDYVDCDALDLAELVRSGQASPAELLDQALARTAVVNPQINAVIHLMEARARDAIAAGLPDGPFRGVPFLIKDLMTAYAGEPMRCGSRLFKDFVPPEDEELTRRYRAAGLVIFGKTNTPELGVSNVTEPELFGPTRNPWNLERTSSGSSGGSAAAVAARIVPAANANDGGGSIRTPASNCGLVGLKPSRGRNPTGPQTPDIWWGFIGEQRRAIPDGPRDDVLANESPPRCPASADRSGSGRDSASGRPARNSTPACGSNRRHRSHWPPARCAPRRPRRIHRSSRWRSVRGSTDCGSGRTARVR